VESVNEVTQSAASSAEEMSSATEQLASMAQELQRLMSQFKIEDGDVSAIEGNGRAKNSDDGNGRKTKLKLENTSAHTPR
jgi:hypothetical protein